MRLDAFLTLTSTDNITKGETTDAQAAFPDDNSLPIEILWFGQIVTRGRYENRGIGMNQQGITASRMQLSFMSVIKPLDTTSPLLLKAVGLAGDNNGVVYQSAKITTYFNSGNSTQASYDDWKVKKPYFEIEMKNLNVMRLQLVADGRVTSIAGGSAEVYYQLPDDMTEMGPLEMVDFSFETVKWTYQGERKTAGTATSGDVPPPPA